MASTGQSKLTKIMEKACHYISKMTRDIHKRAEYTSIALLAVLKSHKKHPDSKDFYHIRRALWDIKNFKIKEQKYQYRYKYKDIDDLERSNKDEANY